MTNPSQTLSEIQSQAAELIDILVNIDEIIAGLESYKKGFYPSYLGTNLSLSLIPAGKLKNVVGKTKEADKMKEIRGWAKLSKKLKYGQPSNSNSNFVLLKNGQGWKDKNGDLWNKDQLHKDHWDISDSKGNKIMEIDFSGNLLWPNGPKNKNK